MQPEQQHHQQQFQFQHQLHLQQLPSPPWNGAGWSQEEVLLDALVPEEPWQPRAPPWQPPALPWPQQQQLDGTAPAVTPEVFATYVAEQTRREAALQATWEQRLKEAKEAANEAKEETNRVRAEAKEAANEAKQETAGLREQLFSMNAELAGLRGSSSWGSRGWNSRGWRD